MANPAPIDSNPLLLPCAALTVLDSALTKTDLITSFLFTLTKLDSNSIKTTTYSPFRTKTYRHPCA
jgi:hypothetical protein